MKVWIPHSTLLKPVHRPALSDSPLAVFRVQGWHQWNDSLGRGERVIRNVVLAKMTPNVFPGPVRHWIKLHDIAPGRLVDRI